MVKVAPSRWNVANAVTIGRIALVPFFAAVLVVDGGHSVAWRLVATVVFVVAALTDRLDGYLARRHNLVTDLGALLDPIADKLLIGTALVILSMFGELYWWVTVVILVRELGITALRFLMLKRATLPVSRGGKLKTVVQSVAISLFLLPLADLPFWVLVVASIVMGLAVTVTVATGADYVREAVRLVRGGAPGRVDQASGPAPDLLAALGARGWTVAVAESLTGGLVASALVDVPGASRTMRGGVVAYATDLKASLLDVPADLLAARGAVDPDVAAAMALGARVRLGADVGLATTGVAGPDPQDGFEPGTVHVAVATVDGVRVESARLDGDRAAVRTAARDLVLTLAIEVVGRAGTGGPLGSLDEM